VDILKVFDEKLAELGSAKIADGLEIPQGLVSQISSRKKSPGYKTCQRILDLWANGACKSTEAKIEDDGSAMSAEYDTSGALSMSYCPPEWGKKKAAWEGRDVCLCIPSYKEIPGPTFFTLMALAMKYRMAIRLEHRDDDSMITRSRNHLAKRFMDSKATWSIWFDTDMLFPFGNAGTYATLTNMRKVPEKFLAINTIERLISWDKTIVGGCYWDRRGSGKLIAGGNQPILSPIPSDTLQPVAFVGTGCLAVKRQVFLDIAAKFPETMHEDSLGNESGFFTNIQTPSRMLGEDESFAKRATDAGHPSYLDLGILCGHLGKNCHGIPAQGSKI